MQLPDWTDNFEERILERGYDYYTRNYVSNLHFSQNKITAEVSGTKNYFVNIRFSASDIISMKCTCPFAEKFPCKHQASVLYAAENLQNDQKDNSETKKMLNSATKEQLLDFLQTEFYADKLLEFRFKTMIFNSISEKDLLFLKKQIDKIARKCAYSEYFNYTQRNTATEELSAFFAKNIGALLKTDATQAAFEIVKYTAEKFAEIDDDNYFDFVGRLCEIELNKIIQNANDALSKAIFDWCTEKIDLFQKDYYCAALEFVQNFFETHFVSGEMA